jgi:hypothetical protein
MLAKGNSKELPIWDSDQAVSFALSSHTSWRTPLTDDE